MRNHYYNAIRDALAKAKRAGQAQIYEIGFDEQFDPSLVAYRIYKNRDDADVIIVSVGNDAIWQALPIGQAQFLYPRQLMEIKKKHEHLFRK